MNTHIYIRDGYYVPVSIGACIVKDFGARKFQKFSEDVALGFMDGIREYEKTLAETNPEPIPMDVRAKDDICFSSEGFIYLVDTFKGLREYTVKDKILLRLKEPSGDRLDVLIDPLVVGYWHVSADQMLDNTTPIAICVAMPHPTAPGNLLPIDNITSKYLWWVSYPSC